MAKIQEIAIGTLAPALARRAKFSWIGYGVAAYAFLRVAKHYGWFGEYPDKALTTVENTVRSAVGMSPKAERAEAAIV